MILAFTICSNNYLAQAITLGYSLFLHNSNYKFIIGLVDKRNNTIDYTKIPFEILEVEKIGISDFDSMFMKYNIVELNTAVKPFYFNFFFNTTKYESIIYLDPDIEVFAPFEELEKELRNHDIIITPHFVTPLNDDKWQAEEDFLNSGIYNLGFIAIKKSTNSLKMIEWWADRLRTKASIDFCRGLFTDQIWINFVPIFFENVKIFRDPGYNVAFWNLHERTIQEVNNKYYINQLSPLVFYHYASFRPLNPEEISLYQNRFSFKNRPDVSPLFDNYCKKVFLYGYMNFYKIPCYYVEQKNQIQQMELEAKIQSIPRYKKIISFLLRQIRKVYRRLIRKMGVVLDPSVIK